VSPKEKGRGEFLEKKNKYHSRRKKGDGPENFPSFEKSGPYRRRLRDHGRRKGPRGEASRVWKTLRTRHSEELRKNNRGISQKGRTKERGEKRHSSQKKTVIYLEEGGKKQREGRPVERRWHEKNKREND